MSQHVELLEDVLTAANVKINGGNPQDIRVQQHLQELLACEFLTRGNLGLGELYEIGVWDCKNLQALYRSLLEAEIRNFPLKQPKAVFSRPATWPLLIQLWGRSVRNIYRHQFTNLQEEENAYTVGRAHYDNVHDLAGYMLGDYMTYSCGHWKHASTLEEAQEEKFELLCKKMQLESADRLLDVGCGWGSMMRYAAEEYGVDAVGITVSEKQAKYINENLADNLTAYVLDYRNLGSLPDPHFDAVVSVGMFEHVGPHNYAEYTESIRSVLETGGRFVLQTIATYRKVYGTDPWIDKYIFPRGKLPSIDQAKTAISSALGLVNTHDFAVWISTPREAYYKQTLDAWSDNLHTSVESGELKIPDRLNRRMRLYLNMCAAVFSAEHSKRATVIQVIAKNL